MALNGKRLNEKKMFPSRTGRDGRVRGNSARDARGQGRAKSSRFVHCKQCGFVFDMTKTNHSGGTQSGNGGYGAVTKTQGTAVTDIAGDSYVDDGTVTRYGGHGEQTVGKGSGCPFCGSKNGV